MAGDAGSTDDPSEGGAPGGESALDESTACASTRAVARCAP